MKHVSSPFRGKRASRAASIGLANAVMMVGGALAASAVANYVLAKRAERANPPEGRFVEVDGVSLHYVESGTGDPLVLLHGNGSMIQDFETSGLVDLAAKSFRVIVFDRPGYGYSERPRTTVWSADAQANLIHSALARLGVSKAVVLGHSWGASVAASLALRHPETVTGLVLASGYYYPSVRSDVVTASGPAVPVIGDLMRYTVSPMLGRAIWPLLMRKIFGPASMPAKFAGFPVEMALRPSTIRASAAESALMIPNAFAARGHYAELKMPVSIIAGDDDRIVDIEHQSARLHREVSHSTFDSVPGEGHMIHQTATARVMAAIDTAAGR
ncbi:alpha/beta fold hydrolase [Lichenifustis flavocetrariae]